MPCQSGFWPRCAFRPNAHSFRKLPTSTCFSARSRPMWPELWLLRNNCCKKQASTLTTRSRSDIAILQQLDARQCLATTRSLHYAVARGFHPLIAFAIPSIQLAKAIHGRVPPTGIAISNIAIENSPASNVTR